MDSPTTGAPPFRLFFGAQAESSRYRRARPRPADRLKVVSGPAAKGILVMKKLIFGTKSRAMLVFAVVVMGLVILSGGRGRRFPPAVPAQPRPNPHRPVHRQIRRPGRPIGCAGRHGAAHGPAEHSRRAIP